MTGVSIGVPAPEGVANSVIKQAARASWNVTGKVTVTHRQLGAAFGQSQARPSRGWTGALSGWGLIGLSTAKHG